MGNDGKGAIGEFRRWREEMETERERRKRALLKELEGRVPKELRRFVEETIVVEAILVYGQTNAKVNVRGPADVKRVRGKLRKLRHAWQGLVRISSTWEPGSRMEIFFKAI